MSIKQIKELLAEISTMESNGIEDISVISQLENEIIDVLPDYSGKKLDKFLKNQGYSDTEIIELSKLYNIKQVQGL